MLGKENVNGVLIEQPKVPSIVRRRKTVFPNVSKVVTSATIGEGAHVSGNRPSHKPTAGAVN